MSDGQRVGFYIYGDDSSGIKFEDNSRGNAAENSDLIIHRGVY